MVGHFFTPIHSLIAVTFLPLDKLLIDDYGRGIFQGYVSIGVTGALSAFSALRPHSAKLLFYPVPDLKQPESGVTSHFEALTEFLKCFALILKVLLLTQRLKRPYPTWEVRCSRSRGRETTRDHPSSTVSGCAPPLRPRRVCARDAGPPGASP